MKYNKLNME